MVRTQNAVWPLAVLMGLGMGVASAQDTTIDSDTTASVSTSTAGSIEITGDGSITVTDSDALTIDSDDDVTMDGAITIEGDAASVAAVRVIGDRTFSYNQNGDVTLDSSIEIENGVISGDYPGARYGFLLENGGSITGDLSFGSGATFLVEGDNSGAVVLGGDLAGNFTFDGSVGSSGGSGVLGDSSVGIGLQNVDGDVVFGPSADVSVLGVETDGIRVDGDITGAFRFGGEVSATGYTLTAQSSDADENEAQAARTSGHAIRLRGDVGGGILLDGFLDGDGDGVFDEGADPGQAGPSGGRVRGSGHALYLDGSVGALTVGRVAAETGLPDGYGDWSFINRGTYSASGIFDGVTVETIRLENATFTDGFRNEGTIGASSVEADATTLRIASGTTLPEFLNEVSVTTTSTGEGFTAYGTVIDAGASLSTITNNGRMTATNAEGSAIVVQDLSGSLTSFTNTGFVGATSDFATTSDRITLDARTSAADITFVNTVGPDFDPEVNQRSSFGIISGDIALGSGNDTFTSDAGGMVGDLDLGVGNNAITFSDGSTLNGTIILGSGNDQVVFDGAEVVGDLDFGGGADSFLISGGTTWSGDLDGSTGLNLDIDSSTVSLNGLGTVDLASLRLANDSLLSLSVASTDSTVPRLNVAGTATIEASGIDILYTDGFEGSIETTLIQAGTLNIDLDEIDLDALETSSFLVEETLSLAEGDPNTLILTRRRREAGEVGLFAEEEVAFEPVLAALAEDDDLSEAIYSLSGEENFTAGFRQLLPHATDMPVTTSRIESSIIASLTQDRSDLFYQNGPPRGRLWAQEQVYYVDRSEGRGFTGYTGGGLVVALGADMPLLGLDVVGVAGSISTARLEEAMGQDSPVNRNTFGVDVYAGKKFGGFAIDGRWGYGSASTSSSRSIDLDGELRDFDADWDGTKTSASGRIQYTTQLGGFQLTPTVSLDYLSLDEDGYTEENPDESLALTAEDRSFTSMRVNTGVALSWDNRGGVQEPESFPGARSLNTRPTISYTLRTGASFELESDPLEATYSFGGENPFTLETPLEETSFYGGGDLVYRNGVVRIIGGLYGEVGDETTVGSFRLSVGLNW